MNEVFKVKLTAQYYLRDKNKLYSRNPEIVVYGMSQSRLWHLKSGQ